MVFFLAAHLPLYLYPFLKTKGKTAALHLLRLSTLKVIGELIKVPGDLLFH